MCLLMIFFIKLGFDFHCAFNESSQSCHDCVEALRFSVAGRMHLAILFLSSLSLSVSLSFFLSLSLSVVNLSLSVSLSLLYLVASLSLSSSLCLSLDFFFFSLRHRALSVSNSLPSSGHLHLKCFPFLFVIRNLGCLSIRFEKML